MDNGTSSERVTRIALFGNFGSGNLGNECTLAATITGLAEHAGAAQLYGIGADPRRLTELHGIEAVEIDPKFNASAPQGSAPAPVRALRRLLHEWRELRRARRTLDGTNAMLLVGTGLLEDDTGSLSWFVAVLRWVVAARLSGTVVGFVSMGAGPVGPGLARLFVRSSLRLAHYVSYRDVFSRETMREIGVQVDDHAVYPDLAFGLPPSDAPAPSEADGREWEIGLGVREVMSVADPRVAAGSRDGFLAGLAEFVTAIAPSCDKIGILYGDSSYDLQSAEDLLDSCRARLATGEIEKLTLHDVGTFEELMAVLARQDVVIASRFHNLILAMLLGKPVIALAYHRKHYDLLEAFGLARFAHDWLDFDPRQLATDLAEIRSDWTTLSEQINRRVAASKSRLDSQFGQLAALCETRGGRGFLQPRGLKELG